MSQTYLHGPRRRDSQPLPSTASHSPSSFQQILNAIPSNRGEPGYARAYLEDKGVVNPMAGQKRKHADETGRSENRNSASTTTNNHIAGSSHSKRPSPPFTSPNFKHSRHKERMLAAASENDGLRPQFKLPRSQQREKSLASMSQTNDDTHSHEGPPSNRRRIEHPASSPLTPDISITGPNSSSSATLSTGSSTSTNPFSPAAYNAKHWGDKSPAPSPSTSKRRPFNSTSSAITMDKDRSSSSNAYGKRGASTPLDRRHSTAGKHRERPSGFTIEHINPNGTKISRANDINVPTIDRQIQHPPPDLPSLTRVLNQVPTILTDLNNKQTQLIRQLAVRVNDQEKEIKALRSENEKLDERIHQTEINVAEYVRKKFAEMEKRFDDRNKALQNENDALTEHIDTMGERLTAFVNNKVASMSRIRGASPTPPKSVVIDLQNEEETAQEEATDVFTSLKTP